MAAPIIGGTDRANTKEEAARVCDHPAAEAPFDADNQNNCIHTAAISAGNFPDADVFNMADWEAAFPGQAILPDGRPNRIRLAMRRAQAMVRAVAVNDIVIAEIYMRAMNRTCTSYSAMEGVKK
jgi:hypothetical protein